MPGVLTCLEDNLSDDAFSGLTALTEALFLDLTRNILDELPAGVFDGLSSLERIFLEGNDLEELPDEVFSGLTGLTHLTLGNNPDSGDVLPLTVTVEKEGTGQVRAKVAAGAPFAVEFTPTVVNGSLAASDTKLAVAAGAVDGTAETVTRTSGTTAAVTVDIDLTTQPSLPTNHSGYEFVKATGSEPAEILPAETDTAPVWSTTLTVGVDGGAYGHKDGEGTLGDDDFEYGSPAVTYTVSILTVSTGSVQFRVNKEGLPTADTLTLELGGHEFPFSARFNAGGTLVWYWNVPDALDDPATEFPVGATATACLRTATQTCPAGRIVTPSALPTLSIADASGAEGDGVEFTATLTAGAAADVTATWTASIESGDTASTADLATTTTGPVTVMAGQTEAKFTVPVNDDTTDEPDQTFTLTLSGVSSNAQLAADPTAEGTIDDDDDPPTLTVADLRHDEGDLIASVTVSLSEVSEKRVIFGIRGLDRAGDTASDADWQPNESVGIFIEAGTMSGSRGAALVLNDTLDEDDETLTVEAYDLQNAQGSSSDREATITIVDDDPTPTVTVAAAAAAEGDKVAFAVTLSAVSGRDVEVGYATSVATGDTAVSGTDFTAATGTLTIPAADGTATGTVEVQTTQDSAEEDDETFTLTLSATKNVALGTPSTAKGTIEDNDAAAVLPTLSIGNASGDEGSTIRFPVTQSAAASRRR